MHLFLIQTACSASLSGNSGASSSRAPAAPVTKTGAKIGQIGNNAPISGKACSAGLSGNSSASSSRAPAAPEDGNTGKITPKLGKTKNRLKSDDTAHGAGVSGNYGESDSYASVAPNNQRTQRKKNKIAKYVDTSESEDEVSLEIRKMRAAKRKTKKHPVISNGVATGLLNGSPVPAAPSTIRGNKVGNTGKNAPTSGTACSTGFPGNSSVSAAPGTKRGAKNKKISHIFSSGSITDPTHSAVISGNSISTTSHAPDSSNGVNALRNTGLSARVCLSPNGIIQELDRVDTLGSLSPLGNFEELGWNIDSAGECPGESDGSVEGPEDPHDDIEGNDIESDNTEGYNNERNTDSISWDGVDPEIGFLPQLFFSPWDTRPSGITDEFPVDANGNELDFWEAFVTDDILYIIATETNKYAIYVIENKVIYPYSRIQRWKPTNIRELKVFFALLFLMPLNKKHVISDYWKNDPLIPTPLFSKYMTRDRFLLIHSMLHFADNNNPSETDRLWKVRDVFEMFTANYKKYFVPFQKLVIDESLILFKGRLAWKQYIPSKRHRFGIKIFVLCDCETGIVLGMIVYTGTNIDYATNDPLGISGAIVKKMMEPYMDKGHILYTDNWYSSPSLCKYLLTRQTGAAGTVKTNRKFYPRFPDTERGSVIRKKSDCGKILSLNWQDRKPVKMITTVNCGDMLDSGKVNFSTQEKIMKPDVVLDYNQNMRLVDKCDCQLSGVECIRKCSKWYHKFFYHTLDVTNLNAYNFYLTKKGKSDRYKFRDFIYNLVKQILEKYGELTTNQKGKKTTLLPDRTSAIGFSQRHYPLYLGDKIYPSGKRKEQRQCYVCWHTKRRPRKHKMTSVICPECKVALCIGLCWRDMHTIPKIENI